MNYERGTKPHVNVNVLNAVSQRLTQYMAGYIYHRPYLQERRFNNPVLTNYSFTNVYQQGTIQVGGH